MNEPERSKPFMVLPNTLHHVRAHTSFQSVGVKKKMTEVIRDLLKERGVAPRKLGKCKTNFGQISYRSDSKKSRIGASMATQRAQNESSINDSTSISVSKANRHVVPAKDKVIIRYNLLNHLSKVNSLVELDNVNKMIYNLPTHIVAIFKDYLIYDDANEFLHRFYSLDESALRLNKIAEYYHRKGRLTPSYVMLNLKKVIQKGNQRKEKVMRIKCDEELGRFNEGSTFFNSKFMHSLAKEDLQNSRSLLPSDSLLEFSKRQGGEQIIDLLDQLSEAVSTKNEPQQQKDKACVRNVLNLYVSDYKRLPFHNEYETKVKPEPYQSCNEEKIAKKRCQSAVGPIRFVKVKHGEDNGGKVSAGRNMKRIPSIRSEFHRRADPLGRNIVNTKSFKVSSHSNAPRIKVNLTTAGANSNSTATIILHNCKVALNSYLTSHTRAPSFSSNPTGSTIGNMKGAKSLRRIICQTQRGQRSDSHDNSRKLQGLTERGIKLRPTTRIKERKNVGLGNFTIKSIYNNI